MDEKAIKLLEEIRDQIKKNAEFAEKSQALAKEMWESSRKSLQKTRLLLLVIFVLAMIWIVFNNFQY